MKKLSLATLTALSLSLNGWTAHLVWTPATPTWDLLVRNWLDTNTATQVSYVQGDTVRFDDSGLSQPAVTLGTNSLTPGAVTVAAAAGDYTLTSTNGGKLSGAVSLLKQGGSALILDADNAITGTTTIEAGTLQIGAGTNRGSLGLGPVLNSGTLAINRTSTLNLSNSLSGAGGLAILSGSTGTINVRGSNTYFSGPIVHNGAIANFLAPDAVGAPSSLAIAIGGAASNVRCQIGGGIALRTTCPVTFSGAASGSVRCALQSMDGTNSVFGPISVGPGGAGGIVQLMAMNAGSLFVVNSPVADLDPNSPYAGNFYLRGTTGAGQLYGTIYLPAANLIKNDVNGVWTIYSTRNVAANTLVAQGLLRLGTNHALPNAPLVIGQVNTRAILDLGGFEQQVTTLNDVASGGTPSTATTNTIANSSTTSDSVLTLSGGGYYGGYLQDSISNGTRKVGLTLLSGAQQLTNLCTYSGPTSIRGGGLVLVGSGSIPNTATIDIASGAVLNVAYRADATFALGASQTLKGNGTFNIVGKLTSQGTIHLKLNKTGGTLANDALASLLQVTYGGTLTLELGGDPLSAGDSFKLFSATNYDGAFTALTPATPGAGLAWDVSKLTADGSLQVVTSVATNPTNITTTVLAGGTQLQLAWPSDHTGWTLQTQTNSLSTGIGLTWFDVPGSTATNAMILPIDRANGSVCYRLRY
jgi:autotransporter-associated beta strand protein